MLDYFSVFSCSSAGANARVQQKLYLIWNADNSTQKYIQETSLTSDLTVWGF